MNQTAESRGPDEKCETTISPIMLEFNRASLAHLEKTVEEAKAMVDRGEARDFQEAYEALCIRFAQEIRKTFKAIFIRPVPVPPNLVDRMRGRKTPVKVMMGYGWSNEVDSTGFGWRLANKVPDMQAAREFIERIRRANHVVLDPPVASTQEE